MNTNISIQSTGTSLLVMLIALTVGHVAATASTTIDGTLIVEPQLNVMKGVVFKGEFDDENPPGIPASGEGARFMWYPQKAAVRAGYVESNVWNDPFIGNYSLAVGFDARASGEGAVAFGHAAAIGHYSFAMGGEMHVYGNYAVGFGGNNEVEGPFSFVAGLENEVYSSARSVVLGTGNYIDGNSDAIAIGRANASLGNSSVALGRNLQSSTYATTTIGHYNQNIIGSSTAWNDADPIFVIGNGNGISNDPDFRRNAMVVLKNGDTTINGGLHVQGKVTFNQAQGDILMGQFGQSGD